MRLPSHVNKTYNQFKSLVVWTWGSKGYETKKNFENLISLNGNSEQFSLYSIKRNLHGSLSRLILVLYPYIWHCVHQKHADTTVEKWSGNCNHRTITFLCFFSFSFKKRLFSDCQKAVHWPKHNSIIFNTMLSAIGFFCQINWRNMGYCPTTPQPFCIC